MAGAAVMLAGTAVPPTALAGETENPATEEPAETEESVLREGQIVTVAGTGDEGYSGDGHDALDARINTSANISFGPDGSLYIADSMNKRLRVVSPDGVIDTVPDTRAKRTPETDGPDVEGWTLSPSNAVRASAVGPDGSMYLAANQDIRRVDESGEHHVIGGNGEKDFDDGGDGGDGGPAIQAWIFEPSDIAVDDDGSVYVADRNNLRVRSIDPDGTITTVAGGGELSPGENEGGQATESKIFDPQSVEVDSAGTVYVSHGFYVSEIRPDGTISTVTGLDDPGDTGDDAPPEETQTGRVSGLAVDAEDNLYIADRDHGVVRRVDDDGKLTTVGVDFDNVGDIAIGPDGNLYFVTGAQVKMFVLNAEPPADSDDGQDDESPWSDLDPGDIATVAGVERDPEEVKKEQEAVLDGEVEQPALDDGAKPRHVAAGPDGTVYYTAENRLQVGAVAPDGTVEVIAGTGERGFSGDGGPAAEAELESPGGLAVDDDGVVYVAENGRVRMIDQDGVISTVVGTGPGQGDEGDPLGDDGPATEAAVTTADVAVGPDGSLYIADSGNERIRRVDPDGVITTVAGGGDLWAEEADDVAATEASLFEPRSVAVDADGNVYFTETGLSRVRMIAPDGVLTTIAGDSYLELDEGGFAGDGEPAGQAELNTPTDVSVGPDGGVYVADMYNARVRRIGPDGNIDTVAGTGERRDSGDDGPAVEAAIHEPASVAVGADGSFHLTGPDSGTIRRVDPDGTISTVADVSGDDVQTESEDASDIELKADHIAAGAGGSLYVGNGANPPLMVNPDGSITSMPVDGNAKAVVAAGDGSYYVATSGGGVRQLYPDGGWSPVAGGGDAQGQPDDGEMATAYGLDVTELAVDPDGALHLLNQYEDDKTVYRLEQDGTLTVVAELGEEAISFDGLAVDSDGGVYLTDPTESRVVRIERDGAHTTVAGVGDDESSYEDLRDGDGGDATDATVYDPTDVAVADDDTLYIADGAGVRRVDSGGTISTLYEAPDAEVAEDGSITNHAPRALSIGSNGDVYFIDTSTEQIRVIAQADEAPNPFPWATTAAVGLPLIVVGGAALGIWRRRQLAELLNRLRGQPNAGPDTGGEDPQPAS